VNPKRFFPAFAMGGAAAGFALALPILGDILRCAFCLGVMAGAALAMKLWLDTHRAEKLTPSDAAMLGALSGGATAVVSWVIRLPIRVGFGEAIGDFFMDREFLPTFMKVNIRALYVSDAAGIIISLPLELLVYGIMGALGGFLALKFLFPGRLSTEASPG
jgi:hypothetical protein